MTAKAAITVGFVGLGNMGIPMTRRLVAAGYHVRGFDVVGRGQRKLRSASASSDAGGGVTAVTELGAVGDGADAVILMLPDSNIVERVLLGRLASEPADRKREERAAGQPGPRGPRSSTCRRPTRRGRACWRNWSARRA